MTEPRDSWLRRILAALLGHPRVQVMRVRYHPQIAFFKARLSPGDYLGLQLTLGAAVLLGASWLFGGIAEDVVTGDPLTLVDAQVAQWLHLRATPRLTQLMLVFTNVHSPWPVFLAVVLLTAWLAWKRDWYWLICVSITVPLGMLLNILMKYAFQRARPSFDDPLVVLTTYSFPSGHVAGSTLFYGVVAAMLMPRIASWNGRAAVGSLAIMLVALVALTRLYLGAHYLSDVLAAFAEGVAWLALCLTGMNTYWQHRAARASTPKN